MAGRGVTVNAIAIRIFRVFGLWCPSCARSCERVLRRQEGVREAHLDFASGQLKLAFDADCLSLSRVRELIQSLGFALLEEDASDALTHSPVERMYLVSLAMAWFFGMWVTLLLLWTYLEPVAQQSWVHGAAALLTLPVLSLGAWPFWKAAWHSLKSGTLSLDLFIVIGNTSLYVYSAAEWNRGGDRVFFDSIAMSISTILSLRWLDYRLRTSLSDQRQLRSFLQRQDRVRVIEEDQSTVAELSQVARGRIVELTAGDRIHFDGVLESGSLWIDTSLLTGESQPRLHERGAKLLAGMEVAEGQGQLRVEQLIGERWIDQQLFRERSRISERGSRAYRLERIYRFWLPSLLLIAFVAALAHPGSGWDRLESFALILLVGCPCLLLMAPTILRLRLVQELEQQGISLRHPDVLELIDGIQTLFWDKTGTLTRPRALQLSYRANPDTDADKLLHLAKTLLSRIDHPLRQLAAAATPAAVQVLTSPGRGSELQGSDQTVYWLGQADYVAERMGCDRPLDGPQDGLWLAQNGRWLGAFSWQDELEIGRQQLLHTLRLQGFRMVLASGDRAPWNPPDWHSDFDAIHYALSPQQKAELLNQWQQQAPVAFIGDGLNDRMAMEQADLSIGVFRPEQSPPLVAMIRVPEARIERIPNILKRLKEQNHLQTRLWIGALSYNGLMVTAAVLGLLQPWLAVLAFAGVSGVTLLFSCPLRNETDAPSSGRS